MTTYLPAPLLRMCLASTVGGWINVILGTVLIVQNKLRIFFGVTNKFHPLFRTGLKSISEHCPMPFSHLAARGHGHAVKSIPTELAFGLVGHRQITMLREVAHIIFFQRSKKKDT